MISEDHSSNNGKNKVTKKASHGNILNEGKKKLTPREKIELEVIHICIETDVWRDM